LFGNEFGLVDAVADPDPSIGASEEEEARVLREPSLDAGESLFVSQGVLGHGLFPAVDPGELRLPL